MPLWNGIDLFHPCLQSLILRMSVPHTRPTTNCPMYPCNPLSTPLYTSNNYHHFWSIKTSRPALVFNHITTLLFLAFYSINWSLPYFQNNPNPFPPLNKKHYQTLHNPAPSTCINLKFTFLRPPQIKFLITHITNNKPKNPILNIYCTRDSILGSNQIFKQGEKNFLTFQHPLSTVKRLYCKPSVTYMCSKKLFIKLLHWYPSKSSATWSFMHSFLAIPTPKQNPISVLKYSVHKSQTYWTASFYILELDLACNHFQS